MTALEEFVNSPAVLVFCAVGIAMCVVILVDIFSDMKR
jgi:hypothetical protein